MVPRLLDSRIQQRKRKQGGNKRCSHPSASPRSLCCYYYYPKISKSGSVDHSLSCQVSPCRVVGATEQMSISPTPRPSSVGESAHPLGEGRAIQTKSQDARKGRQKKRATMGPPFPCQCSLASFSTCSHLRPASLASPGGECTWVGSVVSKRRFALVTAALQTNLPA